MAESWILPWDSLGISSLDVLGMLTSLSFGWDFVLELLCFCMGFRLGVRLDYCLGLFWICFSDTFGGAGGALKRCLKPGAYLFPLSVVIRF